MVENFEENLEEREEPTSNIAIEVTNPDDEIEEADMNNEGEKKCFEGMLRTAT